MAQFTEKAIAESLIKLLNEKPLDKITIKDIVEDCGINRNTFYYHFEDIPSLVKMILNGETQRVLMGRQEEMISWEEDFIRAAQFALQNKKVVYHIYNSVQREDAEKYLYNIAGDVMLHYVEAAAEGGKAKEEDKKLIADFYKSALVGMTLEWLNSGMKYSPEPLIRRLGVMLKGNIEEALKRVEG
ncbi:MAG: TetR family transcriptional regulator [Lachnospiraceae bacterium]|nr:TetR family transcriptional regulator [Lachnospiraceae bacterium]